MVTVANQNQILKTDLKTRDQNVSEHWHIPGYIFDQFGMHPSCTPNRAKNPKFEMKNWNFSKKYIDIISNPFKFSQCQQIPPLFFRRDSLTSYHLCYTRPMANVRLKYQSALQCNKHRHTVWC